MYRWALLILLGVLIWPIAAYTQRLDRTEVRPTAEMGSNWGRTLNPAGTIPREGFKAIYFNRQNPSQIVAQEYVDDIAIKYAWSDFHNIRSEDFGAYWVGRLDFPQGTTKQISVSQSWAKSRILIDGRIVFDGANDSKSFVHQFGAGEHVIEVEFINNWHTTEYKVTLQDVTQVYSVGELRPLLREAGGSGRLYYGGVYESSAKDTSITVLVPGAGPSDVLWLSSYEAIDWTVSPKDRLAAVVVSSYAPGSRVRGMPADRVFYVKERIGGHSETRRCSCTAGHYHCEDRDDLDGLATALNAAAGLRLRGYAMQYSASALSMKPYDDEVRTRVRGAQTAATELQNQCKRQADPDFDTMFKQ